MAFSTLSLFRSRSKPEQPQLVDQVEHRFRLYPSAYLKADTLRAIMIRADEGYTQELMELLDDVSSDPHIAALLRTRKLSVAGASWIVEPGEDGARGETIALEATDYLKSIPSFTQFKMDLLDAIFRGFAAIQPRLGYVEDKLRMISWYAVESRFFRFDYNSGIPLIMTRANTNGEPLPAGVLWAESRDKPGSVIRGGIGRALVKFWMYKGYNLIDLASFLERFGQPHIQVTVPKRFRQGSREFEDIKDAARSMLADLVGIVPEDTKMELIESMNKSGTVKDMYLASMDWLDRQCSKSILGQVMTIERQQGAGGYADAKIANDVRQDLKDADGLWLSNFITENVIGPFVALKFGPNVPLPRLEIDVAAPEDQMDLSAAQKSRAEALAVLRGMGLPISKSQLYTEFGLEEPENEEDTLKADPVAAPVGVKDPGNPPNASPVAPGSNPVSSPNTDE